jgi:hypothetical protein
MSDTNRVKLAIVEETTAGTTPATNPAMQVLRYTGAPKLGVENKYITSKEIISSRNITDAIHVDRDATGDVGFELSFGCLDMIIEGALFNDWTVRPTVVNAASDDPIEGVVASSDTITCGTHSFLANHLVALTGFGEAGNNLVSPIVSVAATTITLGDYLVDEDVVPVGARIRVVGVQGATSDFVAVTAGGNAITCTAFTFAAGLFAAGDWVKIGGDAATNKFATAATNGWARISAVAAKQLTFDVVPAGFTADAGDAKQITISIGDSITNSTTKKSYSIEESFLDHTSTAYVLMTGASVNTLNFDVTQVDVAKATANFMGYTGTISTTRCTTTEDIAAPTWDVLNTSSNVGRIACNNTAIASPNYVLKAGININNSLRKQTAVGSIGAIGIGAGRCDVTGNLNTYFGDKTLVDYSFNATEVSFDIRFEDTDDHVFLIDLPKIKFTGGVPDISGTDADVVVDMPFQAMMHPTLGYTIKIQQFYYVE